MNELTAKASPSTTDPFSGVERLSLSRRTVSRMLRSDGPRPLMRRSLRSSSGRIAGLILLFLLLPASAFAQTIGGRIAFGGRPSQALIQNAPVCASLTNVTSISVGINAQGANRLALAIVHSNEFAANLTGITTGAQNFTVVGTADDFGVKVNIARLIAPTLGTQTVTANFSAETGAVSLCVINFENVNQTTPTQNYVEASGGAGPVSLTTSSAVGNAVISVFVAANNFINTTNDSELVYTQIGGQLVARIGSLPGASSVTLTQTLTGVNAHNAALIDIVKAP